MKSLIAVGSANVKTPLQAAMEADDGSSNSMVTAFTQYYVIAIILWAYKRDSAWTEFRKGLPFEENGLSSSVIQSLLQVQFSLTSARRFFHYVLLFGCLHSLRNKQ